MDSSAEGAAGWPAVRLRRVPWLMPRWAQAQVWGRTILLRRGVPLTEALLGHELAHVDQWRRYGAARFLWRYVAGLVRRGYWRHPLEVEARAAAHDPRYRRWARAVLQGQEGASPSTSPGPGLLGLIPLLAKKVGKKG